MTRVFIWKITAHRNGRKSVFQRSVRHAAMVALLGAFLLKQSKCSVMKMTALSWNVLAKILKIPTGGPPQPLSPGT